MIHQINVDITAVNYTVYISQYCFYECDHLHIEQSNTTTKKHSSLCLVNEIHIYMLNSFSLAPIH